MVPSDLPSVAARLRAAGCVFAEEEAKMLAAAAGTPAELDAMVERRASGLPVEHVVGWAEFCGLRVAVEPGVFVPRRRTEFLVRQAAGLARVAGRPGQRPVVLDLCCGSGALGAALAALLSAGDPGRKAGAAGAAGTAEVHAADIDPVAVRCARRNLAAAGGHLYQGDLYEPLPASLRGRVDLLLANVPYIPAGEIGLLPPEARDHEPRTALDGGADGLEVLRRVAAGAPKWLAPGGSLLTEISDRQAPLAAAITAQAGLTSRVTTSGELNATVLIAAKLIAAGG